MTAVPDAYSPRRVLAGQAIVKFALFATFGAMVSILLPTVVAGIDPEGKVAALAAITTAGFITNAIAQPTVGALSDRTRSRFGPRLPWMAAGAIIGGVALGFTGDATSLLLLGVLWVLVQLGLHGLEVSMDAYLVDAFPRAGGVSRPASSGSRSWRGPRRAPCSPGRSPDVRRSPPGSSPVPSPSQW